MFALPEDEDDTESSSIINSIQLPPWLTKEIISHGFSAAKDILFCVLERAKKEVEELAKDEGTTFEEALAYIDEIDVPYGNILRQLFVWSTTDKVVASCTAMATSVEAAELQEQLHEAIAPPPSRKRSPSASTEVHQSRLSRRRHSLPGLAASIQANQANLQAGAIPGTGAVVGVGAGAQAGVAAGAVVGVGAGAQAGVGVSFGTSAGVGAGAQAGSAPGATAGAGASIGLGAGVGAAPSFNANAHPYPPGQPPSSAIKKLGDVVIGLTKMQESYINQQALMQQQRLDGLQTIHYTVDNNLRRIGTTDGQTMAPTITRLATEMVGAKKKYIALELFQLEINSRGIRCQITPAMLDALFIGNFGAMNSASPAPVGPFSCAVSFTGTRLEDIDASMIYRRLAEDQPLTGKETEALYKATYLIVTSANQLTKVMKIISAIFEVYIGVKALISYFYRDWASFVEENEEHIAEVARTTDRDLPAKIQAICGSIANEFCSEARFYVPRDIILDSDDIKRSIMRRTFTFTLPAAIQAILHPVTHQNRGGGERGGGRGGEREARAPAAPPGQLTFDKHNVKEIKRSRKFFKEVIQKQGLFLPNVPKPMYDETQEECGIYLFTGTCNPNCARSGAHVPPTGERKADILEYKKSCIARYNANKPANGQDFQ